MLGAIVGDIAGSVYEHRPIKKEDIDLFPPGCTYTDDTVLTVAVADCILNEGSYSDYYLKYARQYPDAGYGRIFKLWVKYEGRRIINSLGNGSAMRVSPIGWACEDVKNVIEEAEKSAQSTHAHIEGVKGAQAVALAVFFAKKGSSKEHIKCEIERRFGYDLSRKLDLIRPSYEFDPTCPGSVPEALIAFLESENFEDALKKAISLGGDADTQAAIAGAVAHAHYGGIPEEMTKKARSLLPQAFLDVIDAFVERYDVF